MLIIDDEQQMRKLIGSVMQRAGAKTVEAANGQEGLRLLFRTRPDLILLDVLMPGLDGWEVLSRIRQMTDTPVIMLTVLSGNENEVRALRNGADDYIIKPFNVNALLARAEVVLRKAKAATESQDPAYDDGYLTFDRDLRRITVDGESVHLTRNEYELLRCLIDNNGRVCTYDYILDTVWGGRDMGSIENVHVFIWQLRKKIEPNSQEPLYILNEPGVGYYFARAKRS